MNETMTEKAEAISALADGVDDQVFKASLNMMAESMKLATRFKRIDMAFLQMRGDGGIPKFAILGFDDFANRVRPCSVEQFQGYDIGTGVRRFAEFFQRGASFSRAEAWPETVVPQSVIAVVENVRDEFDEVLVAWEANWQIAKGDPLVIGRRGAYYFLIASWDLTKLETFVADVFTK